MHDLSTINRDISRTEYDSGQWVIILFHCIRCTRIGILTATTTVDITTQTVIGAAKGIIGCNTHSTAMNINLSIFKYVTVLAASIDRTIDNGALTFTANHNLCVIHPCQTVIWIDTINRSSHITA